MILKYKFIRGYSYVTPFAIGFLVANTLQEYIVLPIYTLFFIGVLGIYTIGAIDSHLKMVDEEGRYGYTKLPQIVEIQKNVREIKEQLKSIEKRDNEKT